MSTEKFVLKFGMVIQKVTVLSETKRSYIIDIANGETKRKFRDNRAFILFDTFDEAKCHMASGLNSEIQALKDTIQMKRSKLCKLSELDESDVKNLADLLKRK